MRASGKVVAASATAVKNPRYVKYLSFLFDEYTDMNEYQKLYKKAAKQCKKFGQNCFCWIYETYENDNSQITFITKKAEDSVKETWQSKLP